MKRIILSLVIILGMTLTSCSDTCEVPSTDHCDELIESYNKQKDQLRSMKYNLDITEEEYMREVNKVQAKIGEVRANCY